MKQKITMNIRMSEAHRNALKEIADSNGMSMSSAIRSLIDREIGRRIMQNESVTTLTGVKCERQS
jgi:antitoxin component of RelBE/YafQ-DinJ toxin-antitoxin module